LGRTCPAVPLSFIMQTEFNYSQAFSRNIGWVTVDEQNRLRSTRAAIAGLGGVGGGHLLTLARLGIGNFNIADFDHFEVHNFNRQAGAMMSTVGQPKSDTLARMARDINPTADIRVFGDGVTPENVDDFLKDVDIYIDSIDYFSVESRRLLFAECYKRNIPAVTAAPLGMGVGFLYFKPGRMSFEDYFLLEGQPRREQLLRFMAGLARARGSAFRRGARAVDHHVLRTVRGFHRHPGAEDIAGSWQGQAGAMEHAVRRLRAEAALHLAAGRQCQPDAKAAAEDHPRPVQGLKRRATCPKQLTCRRA
jgi:hypothetical protein